MEADFTHLILALAFLTTQGVIHGLLHRLGFAPFTALVIFPVEASFLLKAKYIGKYGDWSLIFLEICSIVLLIYHIRQQDKAKQKLEQEEIFCITFFLFVTKILVSTSMWNILVVGILLFILKSNFFSADCTIYALLTGKILEIATDLMGVKISVLYCSTLILVAGISLDWYSFFNLKREDELRERKRWTDMQEELKKAQKEQTLIELQKMKVARLTDTHLSFLANLSHEVRTSMNGGKKST